MNHIAGLLLSIDAEEVAVAGLSESDAALIAALQENAPTMDAFSARRFLDADKTKKGTYSLDASRRRLATAMEWRQRNSMETVAQTSRIPVQLGAYMDRRVRVMTGVDYEGNPVQFERLGAFIGGGLCSVDEAISGLTAEDWLESYTLDMEMMFTLTFREASLKADRPIDKYTFVADCAGIARSGMWSLYKAVKLVSRLSSDIEICYPEIAKNIVLFNLSPKIVTLFNWLTRYLDEATASKIELHAAGDDEALVARFQALFPLSCVPAEYGGSSTKAFPPLQFRDGGDDAGGGAPRWATKTLHEVRLEAVRRATVSDDGAEVRLVVDPHFAPYFADDHTSRSGGGGEGGSESDDGGAAGGAAEDAGGDDGGDDGCAATT